MRPLQYMKRLVVFVFVIEVTSRPATPYESRIINFLGSSIGGKSVVGCGKYCDNARRHHYNFHQKNIIGTGSDSSLAEISFQPLRELESVSSSFYPLEGKKLFDENESQALPSSSSSSEGTMATPSNLSSKDHINQRQFTRLRRISSHSHQHHRQVMKNEDSDNDNDDNDFQSYHQQYPDESFSSSSIENPPTTVFTPPVMRAMNGIPYPVEDPFGFMHHGPQYSIQNDKDLLSSLEDNNDNSMGNNFSWDIFKEGHKGKNLKNLEEEHSYTDPDLNNKRNALAAFKRQKFKSYQTQFVPSISGGSMSNLGDFFKNLKSNIEFMEKGRFSNSQEDLLEGDHPLKMFREEINSDGTKPTGTAAFIHAIRNYRPSQRIRSLVALNPEGYHGSQFLDPNYMWLGLGKR